MKVKIISAVTMDALERDIEWWINELQKSNTIVDIKFGGYNYEYSAMIIYK